MIKGLDETVVASEQGGNDFSPIPKGTYFLKLVEVGAWEDSIQKNMKVIAFDDRFQKMKDANDKDITEIVPEVHIFKNKLKFEVIEGAQAKKTFFHFVSTHPNIPWAIPNLVHAFGVPSLKLSQFKTLIGQCIKADLDIEPSKKGKVVTDKDTGIETITYPEYTVAKRFYALTDDESDRLTDKEENPLDI